MSAESDIYTALSNSSAVAAQVGTRIYPDALPENCPLPALVFSRDGGEQFRGLDGSLHAERVRVRIVAWAETRAVADATAVVASEALEAADLPPAFQDASFDETVGNFAGIVETDWWS